ncbi:hypothetical protein ElyMa_003826700 [Elysia marginata]|uniref:Uncharacterized protein n=1 Tax=Elysia marginata TaxID=1093978 RepID=A0AAV4FGP7_9GAST|nr:hypothetical protein ElyMa_003826700 [Elysia marginata]
MGFNYSPLPHLHSSMLHPVMANGQLLSQENLERVYIRQDDESNPNRPAQISLQTVGQETIDHNQGNGLDITFISLNDEPPSRHCNGLNTDASMPYHPRQNSVNPFGYPQSVNPHFFVQPFSANVLNSASAHTTPRTPLPNLFPVYVNAPSSLPLGWTPSPSIVHENMTAATANPGRFATSPNNVHGNMSGTTANPARLISAPNVFPGYLSGAYPPHMTPPPVVHPGIMSGVNSNPPSQTQSLNLVQGSFGAPQPGPNPGALVQPQPGPIPYISVKPPPGPNPGAIVQPQQDDTRAKYTHWLPQLLHPQPLQASAVRGVLSGFNGQHPAPHASVTNKSNVQKSNNLTMSKSRISVTNNRPASLRVDPSNPGTP